MTNVYDLANALAKALKESDEYKQAKEFEAQVAANDDYVQLAREYMNRQMEISTRQMMGQELSDDEIRTFNAETEKIMGIPALAGFYQNYMRFSMTYNDVMEIVGKDIDIGAEIFEFPDFNMGFGDNVEGNA